MRNNFQAEGVVSFVVAIVDRGFQWREVKKPEGCTLDLRSARIGTLWDDEESWPAKLYLDGLVYDRLYNRAPLGWQQRLEWLRRQDRDQFVPQPYMQLANVLKEMGHEVSAREILIAKQEDPARVKALTRPQRAVHHGLGLTIGYGYRPWRALWSIIGFILFGWLLFHVFDGQLMVLANNAEKVPTFNAVVYSIDSFVPLIDFHQMKYRLPVHPLRIYHWFHIFMGWVLTTLLVVGLTGLVRK